MMAVGKRGTTGKRVRLAEVAERAGVSIATVSRALSGTPGVHPDLVARIRRTAQDLGYALPSPLTGRRVMVLASAAAMVDLSRSLFTFGVMQGLTARAGHLKLDLVTRAVSDPAEERAALAEAAVDPAVAGLLFLTLDDEAMLDATRGFGKPIVLVNGDDPLMQLSSVAPSNRAAAALATDHLIRLGHRRILFLTRPGRRTIERRMEGWRDRMRVAGTYDPGLVVEVDDWLPELAAERVAERLARGRDFTAILTAADSLAFGAMQALQAAGVSVPGEVSLVGMDGLPQGEFLSPPLSAIRMPMQAIGAASVDLLREMLTGLPLPARRVELACAFIARGSSGPA